VAPKALMCGDSRSFVRHAGVDGHLGLSSLAGLKSVAWPAFWPGQNRKESKGATGVKWCLASPTLGDLRSESWTRAQLLAPHPQIHLRPFPISFACKCARVLAQHKAIVFPVCKKYAKLKFMRN